MVSSPRHSLDFVHGHQAVLLDLKALPCFPLFRIHRRLVTTSSDGQPFESTSPACTRDALDADTPDVLLPLSLRFPLKLCLTPADIEYGLAVPRKLDFFLDLTLPETFRRPLLCALLELFGRQRRPALDLAVDVETAQLPVLGLVQRAQTVILDLER